MKMFFLQLSLVPLLLILAVSARAADDVWPMQEWTKAKPADVGMDEAQLRRARDYALTSGGSGFITRRGKLVMQWGDPSRRYDLKSTTKSIGVTALGLATADKKIRLEDRVVDLHPTFAIPPNSNKKTGWIEKITIQHLATQTAGFEKRGGYAKLIFEPGTKWSYSDGGPNWLAECVTLAYRRDVDELMFERVFTPLGIDRKDLTWRRNSYRDAKIDGVMRREFGSGIHANVDAMARIGYLYLRKGKWNGKQIIPSEFVRAASRPVKPVVGLPEVDPKRYGNASDHYGLLWWNNADGTLKNVPRDAYWSWGLYESLIVVIPSLDIVVARAGKSWQRKWDGHYDVLKPFFEPIVNSVREDTSSRHGAPSSAADPRRVRETHHSQNPVVRFTHPTSTSSELHTIFVAAKDDESPYRSSPVIEGIE
ncbi:MAG: serine hydrolase, partial [Planctomycetes bacterium]|nr:serine hydrolase [Planctomycetota bacterium]